MTTSIRRLVPDDAPAYRALMLHAYAAHPEAFTSSAGERAALPLDWWRARLAPDASDAVFGAFIGADGVLSGVAGLSVESRAKSRHKGTLFGMYVADEARGHGLGAALVQAVLAAAGQGALRVLQLTVTEGNRQAQALYEAQGFRSFGVEPMAVCVDGRYFAKVHMWREIGA